MAISTDGGRSWQPVPDVTSEGLQLSQDIINVQEFDQISINELGEDAANISVEDEKRTLALSIANQIVSVVTAWVWAYLTFRAGTRLITGQDRTETPALRIDLPTDQAHPPAGSDSPSLCPS